MRTKINYRMHKCFKLFLSWFDYNMHITNAPEWLKYRYSLEMEICYEIREMYIVLRDLTTH